ncbi:MAG: GNAT family N-acetyltransferase [Leptolyngbyaceae cyanobacterium bins.349]|nr:GNAT family N-acetyltransferase [Leptolyngbyaceae cyanobacterium bins.349]
MQIRPFTPDDADQIAQLFHDTIRTVNRQDYTPEQVAAWAPDNIHFQDWTAFCTRPITLVADDAGTIAGFATLEPNGYLNCFYCHTQYQRRGVGSQLYTALETRALALGCDRLFTAASITAKPFFQRHGFTVIQEQTVTRRGVHFINFQMEKWLVNGRMIR